MRPDSILTVGGRCNPGNGRCTSARQARGTPNDERRRSSQRSSDIRAHTWRAARGGGFRGSFSGESRLYVLEYVRSENIWDSSEDLDRSGGPSPRTFLFSIRRRYTPKEAEGAGLPSVLWRARAFSRTQEVETRLPRCSRRPSDRFGPFLLGEKIRCFRPIQEVLFPEA